MIYKFKNLFSILFLLIPITLITGPAAPDLTITFGVIFGIFWLVTIEKNISVLNEKFIQISIIFWISLILISFFSINKEKSFQDSIIFIRFLLIPIFCYYLFFVNKIMFKYLLLIIFLTVIFVSIDTLYQFFNYTSKDGFGNDILGFRSEWYGRLTGPFGDELIPGSYVSKFGLLGFVYLLLNRRSQNNLLIQSLYLSTILLVCFASGERMALATYTMGLLALLLFLKNFRLTILVSILIGFFLIFSVYKLHPFYNDFEIVESNQYHQGLKIEKKFKCEEDETKICTKFISLQPNFLKIIQNFNTSAYGEIYLLSFKMFLDYPITGIGISNFQFACNKFQKYSEIMVNYNCASHPHNTYIQWLTEGGLVVLILFIIYLIFLIKFILNNNGDKKYKIISLVVILILFWPVMSTGSLIKNWYGIIVFFIIGVTLCLSRLKNTTKLRS